MDQIRVEQKVLSYITKRACAAGGYCFYRLEEPNPHDTYYALATLALLRRIGQTAPTVRYLQDLQQADGGYVSPSQAYFVLSSLKLMAAYPQFDPAPAIATWTDQVIESSLQPAGATLSFFPTLHYLATLRALLHLPWQEHQKAAVIRAIDYFRKPDGGVGINSATLDDTYLAARVLQLLQAPVPQEAMTAFLRACEHPVFGFTGSPGTALFYLEYLHSGLMLSRLLGYRPTVPEACRAALLRCQTDSGGFSRAHLAIATMVDTYRAFHGLTLLQAMALQ